MKEGKFVGGRTPFGYDKDPNDKNHLVINDEQARLVKRIYDMALNGLTYYKIALILTKEKVKSPAQYYSFKWKNNYNLNYGIWNSKTIYDILTNRIYTGDLVQHRRTKVNYKVKRIVKNSVKDYIIVENTHEPIIDKELFYEVGKLLPKNKGRNEKKENNLLDGLLYCGDCGHRISVTSRRKKDNKHYTICNYYRTYMKQHFCTTHSNNYDVLEQVIIEELKMKCKEYIYKEKVKSNVLKNIKEDNNELELKGLKKEIDKLNEQLDEIYIDKLDKKISIEQFERVKEKLEGILDVKNKKYQSLIINSNELKNIEYNNKIIDKYINKFLNMKNPSRELIVSLIDKIDIFEDKTINVKVTFTNL